MKYNKGSFVTVPNKNHLAGLEPYVQSVYFWICSYADEDGTCFPSRTTLAKNAGCSVKSVDRALELLSDRGFLSKKVRSSEKKKLTNLYQLMIMGGVASEGRQGSVSQSLGVASEGRIELKPILTKPKEMTISSKSSSSSKKDISSSRDTLDSEMEITRVPTDEMFGVPREVPVKAPHSPKNPSLLRLLGRFGDMCHSAIGVRPVPDKKGMAAIKFALNTGGLTEKRVIDLFEDWFDQRKPDEQLMSINAALSSNNINKFKLSN